MIGKKTKINVLQTETAFWALRVATIVKERNTFGSFVGSAFRQCLDLSRRTIGISSRKQSPCSPRGSESKSTGIEGGKAQRIRFATRKKEKTHNFQTSLLNGTLLSGSSTETLAAENAQSHVGFLVSCSTQQEPNYRGTSSKTRCGEQEQKSVQRGGSVAFAWWTIRTL